MFAGTAVKPEPRDEPDEAGGPGDDEGGLPTVPRGEADNENGREGRADRGTQRIDPDGEPAFTGGEPFGDGFGRSGPVARFAETEQETAHAEGSGRTGETGENIRDGPPADEQCQTQADPEAVDDFPGENERYGIGDQKGVEDRGVVFVGETELLLDGGRQDGKRLPVHIVQDGGEKDQRDDPPAKMSDAGHGYSGWPRQEARRVNASTAGKSSGVARGFMGLGGCGSQRCSTAAPEDCFSPESVTPSTSKSKVAAPTGTGTVNSKG